MMMALVAWHTENLRAKFEEGERIEGVSLFNNYNSKRSMRNKHRASTSQQQEQSQYSPQFKPSICTNPLKSPSPDKYQHCTIQSTRTPLTLSQTPENLSHLTPKKVPVATAICRKIGQRQNNNPLQQQQQPAYFINKQESTDLIYNNETAARSTRREDRYDGRDASREGNGDQWVSQQRSSRWGSHGELDYLRIIRQKEQTIRELTELLQLMDRHSSIDNNTGERNKLTNKHIKQLQKQIKVLQIENQCLISVIQNNHVNLPSHKEAILQRQIAELRDSLRLKEDEVEENKHNSSNASEKLLQLQQSNEQLTKKNRQLEVECDKLLNLMKQKDHLQKGKQAHVSQSAVGRGDRLTLGKIKEQYQQNLKLMQSNFSAEIEKIYQAHQQLLKKTSLKLDTLINRVHDLEQGKQALQKKSSSKAKHKPKIAQQNQEIQYLLQRYYKTEKDLQQQKLTNEQLANELTTAQKTLRELSIRSYQTSQILQVSNSLRKTNDACSYNDRINQLQQQNNKLTHQVTQLQQKGQNTKSALQLKLQTVVTCYENQLRDKDYKIDQNIRRLDKKYQQQLNKLRAAINDLQTKNRILKQQTQFLNSQLRRCAEVVTKKDQQIQSLQRQVRDGCLEDKLKESQQSTRHFQQQSMQYKQMAEYYAEQVNSYKIQVVKIQNSYQQLLQKLQKELAIKNNRIGTLQTQLNKLSEKIQTSNNSHKFQLESYVSIEQQLFYLKQALQQLNQQFGQQTSLRVQYAAIQSQLQIKIQQNLRLLREAEALRQDLAKDQRNRLALSHKVASLEKSLSIYEHQNRQRKLIYEQLITQKSKLQRQTLLALKIKLNSRQREPNNQNFHNIIALIDRLCQIDTKRKKQVESLFSL